MLAVKSESFLSSGILPVSNCMPFPIVVFLNLIRFYYCFVPLSTTLT